MKLLPTHILATRSVATENISEVVTVTTAHNSDLSSIRAALSDFLKDNLNIVEVFYHITGPLRGNYLKVICVNFSDDDKPKVVIATNKISDEDSMFLNESKNKSQIVDIAAFDIEDLVALISGLSISEGLAVSQAETECPKKPIMLLAGIDDYGSLEIQQVTSNDPLLHTLKKNTENPDDYRFFSLQETHDFFGFLKDESSLKNPDHLPIDSYTWPQYHAVHLDVGIEDSDSEVMEFNKFLKLNEYVENSVLLSPEFVKAYAVVTDRSLGFDVRNVTNFGGSPTRSIKYGFDGEISKLVSSGKNVDYHNNLYDAPIVSFAGGNDIRDFVVEVNDMGDSFVQKKMIEAVNDYFFQKSSIHISTLSDKNLVTPAFMVMRIYKNMDLDQDGLFTQAPYNAGIPLLGLMKKKDGTVVFEATICKGKGKGKKDIYSLLIGVNGVANDVYVDKSCGLLFGLLIQLLQDAAPEYEDNSKLEQDMGDLLKIMQLKDFGVIHAKDVLQ